MALSQSGLSPNGLSQNGYGPLAVSYALLCLLLAMLFLTSRRSALSPTVGPLFPAVVAISPAVGPLFHPRWVRSSTNCRSALSPAVGPLIHPLWVRSSTSFRSALSPAVGPLFLFFLQLPSTIHLVGACCGLLFSSHLRFVGVASCNHRVCNACAL